jgi:hypothetical protein
MFRFIIISVLLSSCHVFLDEKLPDRSINFHEQISNDARGHFEDLNKYNNSEFALIASAPPIAFFKPGDFSKYADNEKFLFNYANEGKLKVVCTLDPTVTKEQILMNIQNCFKAGGIGLKSYHLHQPILKAHFKGNKGDDLDPIDESTYRQIFKLMQSQKKVFYILSSNQKRVERVLSLAKEFSDLPVFCPNFCYMGSKLDELDRMLKKYPNLTIGYSFIYPKFFFRFLQKQDHEKVKSFFLNHQDRIFFESSLVLDENEVMSDRYMYWNLKNQYSYLKFKNFSYFSPPVIKKAQNFLGLELSDKIIDKIYYLNAKSLLDSLSNSR